jgi:hypothetical protein
MYHPIQFKTKILSVKNPINRSPLRPTFLLIPLVLACFGLSPTAPAQVVILANKVGNPGNIILDNGSVYWSDVNTGSIGSVSKIPGGTVKSYTVDSLPGSYLAQDNASLYFVADEAGGPFVNTFHVFKMSKAAGSAAIIGNDLALGNFIALGGLTIGPAGGILYFVSGPHGIPGDAVNLFFGIASLSTLGGNDRILTYSNPGGVDVALFQHDHLNFWLSGNQACFSTDSTFLYWADSNGTKIWRMPLIGGSATAIVTGRTNIHVIATPTTGAAAGSIFWVEGVAGTARLMRREVGGQIIAVLNGIVSFPYSCFAVDNNRVFCEQQGKLVQVSINGGETDDVANIQQAFAPVGVAVDSNFVYWSSLFSPTSVAKGSILRIGKPPIF